MLARRYDKTGKRRRSVKFVIGERELIWVPDFLSQSCSPFIRFISAESKLEAEYIRRFLGQLSPLEESRLCELKYGLQAHHKVTSHSVFSLTSG